jgi:hypothetical protein
LGAVSLDTMKIKFYVGLGMQLFGLTAVGLCFFSGVKNGDYGHFELAQLVVGSFVFYVGNYLKGRSIS